MTRTFLRIKRRLTEEPLPYIRLEALNRPGELPHQLSSKTKKRTRSKGDGNVTDLDSTNLSNFLDDRGEEEPHSSSASVLWKRLEPLAEETESCRVVDALLENEMENTDDQNNVEGRLVKRRKLTLLDTSRNETSLFLDASSRTPKRKKSPLKILDPLTRMVDDSLQEVHMGNRSIQDHYYLINSDRNLVSSRDPKKWLSWCHSSGGNLLHACALWNDTEMAGTILQIPNLAGPLCEALDGDNRTPYEVAQLSGHDSVCEVLEAFGGDTTNFVYDIFCLEDNVEASNEDDEDAPMTVELTDGVAYWTPGGELMLETNDKISAYLDDDEEEIDSNCEDYDANDYPDDDEEDVTWGYDDHNHMQGLSNENQILHNSDLCALDREQIHRENKSHIYVQDTEDSDEDFGDNVGNY